MANEKAERAGLSIRCALFGPGESGKTMIALRKAKEIAEKAGVPFAVIDAAFIEKPAEGFQAAVYDWLKGDTVPTEPPKDKPKEKPYSFAKTGNEIINEIAAIITSTSSNGVQLFSEEEKEEARTIIKTAPMNESGIQTLTDLRGLFSEERAKREAALKQAA